MLIRDEFDDVDYDGDGDDADLLHVCSITIYYRERQQNGQPQSGCCCLQSLNPVSRCVFPRGLSSGQWLNVHVRPR